MTTNPRYSRDDNKEQNAIDRIFGPRSLSFIMLVIMILTGLFGLFLLFCVG